MCQLRDIDTFRLTFETARNRNQKYRSILHQSYGTPWMFSLNE